MRKTAMKEWLWLLCAFLAAACTFCAATSVPTVTEVPPGSGGNSSSTVLPSKVSTITAPTSAPNTTTHSVTSPVPTVNTTAIVSTATTSSSVTTTTNGSTSITTQSTTQSKPTSISVPTKSSVTSTSSATVTATPASESQKKPSKFDAGSFVGGIVLTLGVLIVLYLGCKFYASKRGVQYRTIDEHEAII